MMKTSPLHFRPFDPTSDRDWDLKVKWANDPEIRHFIMPCRDEGMYRKLDTVLERKASWKKNVESQTYSGKDWHWIIESSETHEPIGGCELMLDPPHRKRTETGVAWFGLTLGEAEARGRGLGREVVKFLEDRGRAQGALLAEVGVFEFNERSFYLFKSLGYVEFARIPNFTWWNGKKWDNVRMFRLL